MALAMRVASPFFEISKERVDLDLGASDVLTRSNAHVNDRIRRVETTGSFR